MRHCLCGHDLEILPVDCAYYSRFQDGSGYVAQVTCPECCGTFLIALEGSPRIILEQLEEARRDMFRHDRDMRTRENMRRVRMTVDAIERCVDEMQRDARKGAA